MHRCAGGLWLQGHTARASLLCSVGKLFHCVHYLSAAPRINFSYHHKFYKNSASITLKKSLMKNKIYECSRCKLFIALKMSVPNISLSTPPHATPLCVLHFRVGVQIPRARTNQNNNFVTVCNTKDGRMAATSLRICTPRQILN